MPATKSHRETTDEKAARLVADNRYVMHPQSHPPLFWVGTCVGDHGTYAVVAVDPDYEVPGIDGRVGCTCRAGSIRRNRKPCSHALGAEIMRTKESE